MRIFNFALILTGTVLALVLVSQAIDTTRLLAWAAALQRDIQNAMAGSLRAVRASDPGALIGLCGLTFAYGFVHALGPGHGKVLMGSVGLSSRATLRRLSLLTLAACLGQSLTAIALTLIGATLVAMTRAQLVTLTETLLAPLSYVAIALLGAWLTWRGLRALWHALPGTQPGTCAPGCACGHRHAPTLADVDAAMRPSEMLALVLSISLRPCTGALFVLLLAWRMQILPAGILATVSMGLGTASFNLMLASSGLGVHMTLGHLGRGRTIALVSPALQVLAGSLVILASAGLLVRAI